MTDADHGPWPAADDLAGLRPGLRAQVASLLRDEYATQESFEALADEYDRLVSFNLSDYTDDDRGALGFIALLYAADRVSAGVDPDARLRGIIGADAAVRAFIARLYRIDLDLYPLDEVVAVGDTSMVIRCTNGFALKLLLPWYRVSATLRAEMDRYARTIRPVQMVTMTDVVPVFDGEARDGWLAMRYVPGDRTLRDKIEERRAKNLTDEFDRQGPASVLRAGSSNERNAWVVDENRKRLVHLDQIRFMETVKDGLVRCLEQLHRSGLHHGDLRPENVVLEDGRIDRPVLVDFGPPPEQLRYAGRHSIVSVYESAAESGWQGFVADLNSLGDILLSTLISFPLEHSASGQSASPESARRETEAALVRDAAAHLRNVAPRVAGVIQQMRAPMSEVVERYTAPESPTATRSPLGLLQQLDQDLTDELRMFTKLSDGGDDPLTAIRRPDSLRRSSELVKLAEVFSQRRYRKEIEEAAREDHRGDWRTIQAWLRVYGAVWWIMITAFVALTIISFGGVADFGISPESIRRSLGALYGAEPGGNPSDWLLLMYRLVALTTAGIAFIYYLNIFSTLDAGNVPRGLVRLMRWGPLVAIVMQLAGMIVFPYAFAWIAGLGGVFICLNNEWWQTLIARRLTRQSEEYKHFHNWPLMMWFFCAGGIVIGVLLDAGLIGSAWFFAFVLTVLNCTKVYATNCTADAPRARGWLTEAAFAHEPLRPPAEHDEQSVPAALPLTSKT